MKKYHIGFTQGTFDMFHIGHLNLLEKAKEYCDYLIVGVNTDNLVMSYKHHSPISAEYERLRIVKAIRVVDDGVLCRSLDKLDSWNELHFDSVFVGDDWKGSERWNETEKSLKAVGVDVVYLPYTKGISSTQIRQKIGG